MARYHIKSNSKSGRETNLKKKDNNIRAYQNHNKDRNLLLFPGWVGVCVCVGGGGEGEGGEGGRGHSL